MPFPGRSTRRLKASKPKDLRRRTRSFAKFGLRYDSKCMLKTTVEVGDSDTFGCMRCSGVPLPPFFGFGFTSPTQCRSIRSFHRTMQARGRRNGRARRSAVSGRWEASCFPCPWVPSVQSRYPPNQHRSSVVAFWYILFKPI